MFKIITWLTDSEKPNLPDQSLLDQGRQALSNGLTDKALDLFDAFIRAHPEDRIGCSHAYTNMGVIYHRTGNLDEAETSFRIALTQNSEHPVALLNLAKLVSNKPYGLWEAIGYAERAAEANPNDIDTWLFLGMLQWDAKNIEACLNALFQAFKLAPDNAGVLQTLAELQPNISQTLLMYAVIADNLEIAELLLIHNVSDIDSQNDQDGSTAAIQAAQLGNTDMLRLLILHGANLAIRNKQNSTVLLAGAHSNNPEIVAILKDSGVDLNARQGLKKLPVLFIAIQMLKTEYAKALVRAGAEVNFLGVNELTPLMMACNLDDQELVEALFEAGADPNYVTSDGFSAFTVAAVQEKPYYAHVLTGFTEAQPLQVRQALEDFDRSVKSGQIKEARTILETAIALNPANSKLQLTLIASTINSDNPADALDLITQALNQFDPYSFIGSQLWVLQSETFVAMYKADLSRFDILGLAINALNNSLQLEPAEMTGDARVFKLSDAKLLFAKAEASGFDSMATFQGIDRLLEHGDINGAASLCQEAINNYSAGWRIWSIYGDLTSTYLPEQKESAYAYSQALMWAEIQNIPLIDKIKMAISLGGALVAIKDIPQLSSVLTNLFRDILFKTSISTSLSAQRVEKLQELLVITSVHLMQNKDYSRLNELLSSLAFIDIDSPQLKALHIFTLFLLENIPGADKMFSATKAGYLATGNKAGYSELCYTLGACHCDRQEYHQAMQMFEFAVQADENNLDAKNALTQLQSALGR